MADVIGLSDVSSKDTGKGSKLKTGNLKRSYTMAGKCQTGEVYNQKLRKCVKSKSLRQQAKKAAKKVVGKVGLGKVAKKVAGKVGYHVRQVQRRIEERR